MELFLNLVWMIVALLLAGALAFHHRGRSLRPHWCKGLAVTLFIVVLLFPAISASDDLYTDMMLSEDSSRHLLQMLYAHGQPAPAEALYFCSVLLAVACAALACVGWLEAVLLPLRPSSVCRAASSLRAPPCAILF